MTTDVTNRILKLKDQLGEYLTANHFKEAYTTAGELNSLLKSEELAGISLSKLTEIIALVKSFYRVNEDMQEHTRKMYGISGTKCRA